MSQTGVNIPLISYGPSGSGVVNVFGLTGSVTQQPVPYVSVSEEMITYGRRWGQSTSITLNVTSKFASAANFILLVASISFLTEFLFII